MTDPGKRGLRANSNRMGRFALAFFAVPIVIILAYAYYSQHLFESSVIEQFQRHQLSLVKSTARGIEESLKNVEAELKLSLAQDPAIVGRDRPQHRIALEKAYLELEGSVQGLYRIDPRGYVLMSYPEDKDLMGTELVEKDFLDKALAAPETFRVGFFPASGEKLGTLTAVMRDGRPVGAVLALVDLRAIAAELLRPIETTKGSQIFLMDEGGRLLYHPEQEKVGKRLQEIGEGDFFKKLSSDAGGLPRNGYFNYENPNTGTEMAAFSTIKFGDRRLVLAKAALIGELAGPIRSNRRNTWGFSAILVSLVAVGAYKFTQFRNQGQMLEMERSLAEEVEATKAFYERLIGDAGDAILVVDKEWAVLTWNKGAERIFGWSAEEAVGRSYLEIQSGAVDENLEDNLARVWSGEMLHSENRRLRKDGTWFDALITATPVRDANGEVIAAQAIIKDITERKRAEEALQESRRRLLTLMGNLPGMAYRCRNDRDWTMEFVSEGCYELTGYNPSELVDNQEVSYGELIHPDDREMVWNEVQAALAKDEPFRLVYRLIAADEKEKWVWEKGSGVYSPEGELLALEGFISDITEQKLSEDNMIRAQARLEYLLTSSPAVIWTARASEDWGATFISSNIKDMLGYEPEEFIEDPKFWVKNLHEEDRESVLEELPRIFEKDYHVHEYRFLHKDGTYRWMHAEVKLVRNPEGKPVECVGFWADVTERLERQEELKRAHQELQEAYESLERAQASAVASEKLAALGRLTAGVSHEILNPLNAITIGLHLLINESETPAATRESLIEIMEQTRRITKISQDLLYFARQRPPERRQLDLNHAVNRTLALVEHELRLKNVDLNLKLSEELPPVLADEDQLQQVVLNLINNAKDALAKGGSLRVQTSESKPVFTHEGRVLELRVEDSGPGIEPSHLDKIFDPFFTTKPEGEGTGLGLSICQGIVENHGGSIWAENLTDGGAAFVVRLGAAKE